MSGEVLNSRFLTRLLTSGEEDIERVSMLKEDISSTACELTTLILFNVTCLTVTSLITKSYQQRWPIHSCSLQGSALADLGFGGKFYGELGRS